VSIPVDPHAEGQAPAAPAGPMERAALLALAALNFMVVLWFFRTALTVIPNTGDEYAILFQARIFSSLRLSAPAPPHPELFMTQYLAVQGGRWFGTYPALYPLLLAVGLRLGSVPALVALLSSATLLLLFRLVRDAYRDRALAWLATLLLAVAPSFRFYSASYSSHAGALLLAVACADLGLRSLRRADAGWAKTWLWLGFAGVLGLGIRPFELFWVLLPLVVLVAAGSRGGRRWAARDILPPLAAAAAAVAALLVFDGVIAGNFYLKMVNSGGRLAVWRNLRWESAARLWAMLADTAKWLFAYGVFRSGNLKDAGAGDWNLSLPLLLAGLGFGVFEAWRDRSLRRTHAALLAVAGCVIIGHIFYDKQHGRFGERRFYEASFIFCLFAARLILALLRRYSRKWAYAVIPALLGCNLAVYLPGTIACIREDNEYRMGLFLKAERLGLHDALIYVRDSSWSRPVLDNPVLLSAIFYARNDPDLKGNVYVVAGRDEDEAARLFPRRPRYEYFLDLKSRGYTLRRF